MATKTQTMPKKQATVPQNTLEVLKDLGTGIGKNAASSLGKVAGLDQLLGYEDSFDSFDDFGQPEYSPYKKAPEKPKARPRQEFSVFSQERHNSQLQAKREMNELSNTIKSELQATKQAASSFEQKVLEVEKAMLQSNTENPGVYQLNLMERLLQIIQLLRIEIGKGTTWLEAFQTRKAKRGSAFQVRSKQKGTQYSLSQELQSSRSVQ